MVLPTYWCPVLPQHQQKRRADVVANYLNVATFKLGGEGRGAEVTASPELISAQLAVGSE